MTVPTSGDEQSLRRLALRIRNDFSDPRLGLPSIDFTSYREWMADGPAPAPVAEALLDDVVCVVGGRSFPIGISRGLEPAVAAVASALQDEAMDHLNRPWPQVGARAVVLEPVVDEAGLAVWASADGAIRCPVGYLTTSAALAPVG